MDAVVRWWDKRQIVLYLVAIVAGLAVGLVAPQFAPTLEHSIEPVLMLLLFATFLGVPLIEVGRAFRDVRFLGTVLVANFVIVPGIAWTLTRFVADDEGLLLGALLVLLTPCIDYVIVFTGLAGGARAAARGRAAADACADTAAAGLSVCVRGWRCAVDHRD